MMSKRNAKKEDDITGFGIIFNAILMALFGAFIGFVYLASFEAISFSSTQDLDRFLDAEKSSPTEGPDAVYFFKELGGSASTWGSKREALVQGTNEPLTFSNGELNSWMGSSFKPLFDSAAPGQEKSNVEILPGVPNFFVTENESMYVSVPLKISLFGFEGKYVAFAQGHFSSGPYIEFVADELYLNSAPIPLIGGIGGQLMSQFISAYSETDDYAVISSTLQRAQDVQMAENSLRLTFR